MLTPSVGRSAVVGLRRSVWSSEAYGSSQRLPRSAAACSASGMRTRSFVPACCALGLPYGSYAALGRGRSADVMARAPGATCFAFSFSARERVVASVPRTIAVPSVAATAASAAAAVSGVVRRASAVALAEKRSLRVESASACSTLNPSTRAASRTALRPR